MRELQLISLPFALVTAMNREEIGYHFEDIFPETEMPDRQSSQL